MSLSQVVSLQVYYFHPAQHTAATAFIDFMVNANTNECKSGATISVMMEQTTLERMMHGSEPLYANDNVTLERQHVDKDHSQWQSVKIRFH